MSNVYSAIQQEAFSLAEQYQQLRDCCPSSGAIVTFTGLVRDFTSSGVAVSTIELSTYKALSKKQIDEVSQNIMQRFKIDGLHIIHRYGPLTPTEQIVYVGVASQHRSDAFAAAEMTMDLLKSRIAFWKKEIYANGEPEKWIEPSADDLNNAERWHN